MRHEFSSTCVEFLLAQCVALPDFGGSTLAKRQFAEDPQMQRAITLLRRGGTQRELFSMADTVPPVRTARTRPAVPQRP